MGASPAPSALMWLSKASARVLAWYAKAGKAEGVMRVAVLILSALALASCATSEDDRLRVGEWKSHEYKGVRSHRRGASDQRAARTDITHDPC